MKRCEEYEDRLWERRRERSAREAKADMHIRWDAAIPEEALPYLHTASTPEELGELAEYLRDHMTAIQLARVMAQVEYLYGKRFLAAAGVATRVRRTGLRCC